MCDFKVIPSKARKFSTSLHLLIFLLRKIGSYTIVSQSRHTHTHRKKSTWIIKRHDAFSVQRCFNWKINPELNRTPLSRPASITYFSRKAFHTMPIKHCINGVICRAPDESRGFLVFHDRKVPSAYPLRNSVRKVEVAHGIPRVSWNY